MTELSFASSFLQRLDSLPTKILPDHVEDPKTYPARSAYILPKMPRPLPKKIKLSPGQERTLTISMKSLRNPPLDITLPAQPLSTSILNLKEQLSAEASIPVSKLRLLHHKKPVQDSKILKELVEETEDKIELGIMVMGGAASVVKKGEDVDADPKVVEIGNGSEVLKTDEFWADLKGFLIQRLKDEREGERVASVFRKALDAEK